MKNISHLGSFLVFLLLWNGPAQASSNGIWSDVAEGSISNRSNREIVPELYRTVAMNTTALRSLLAGAPVERTADARSRKVVLNLPMPDGTSMDFQILDSPIMDPALAARYPTIKTYTAQGITDPTANGRIDWTQFGFHAMIFTTSGTVFIDPYRRGTTTEYISYFKHDLLHSQSNMMTCEGPIGTESETAAEIKRLVAGGITRSTGEQLRTYRLALAADGEYTIFHGGTIPAGMAAIVVAMNRVNGIYEKEVSVRMVLVARNDTLVFTNASTDPYTNNNGSAMLGQNQSTVDARIGSGNYDVGHVFSTGGGGIAGLGVVCVNGQKAQGVTGLPSPIGDPFYVDYVAHEMGHEFGGNHSFNGNAGACGGGNRNGATAYEPGSGTTIMAYAGICSPQNTQNASDDYFHSISIDEIVANTQFGSGSLCPVVTSTGNDAPAADAGSAVVYTIPTGTPFTLTGAGVDPNGDALTYCWEEWDLGPAGAPNTPSGDAPIFRSFRPVASPSRTFPRLSNILSNTQTIGEILPSYERILSFRLMVRDNRAGGGGTGSDITSVVVSNTGGAFLVTYPNTAVSRTAGTTDSIMWNVSNTNVPPVNCTSVNILLSTDGGQTFPVTIASNTPNDGKELITVPNNPTSTARIKVVSVGNIFFDISNANFTITPLVGVNPVAVLPDRFGLEQNFPNPFNPSTQIGFSLPRQSHVRLEVFNTVGERVAVLVNEEREAGHHTVEFQNPGLSSGVYLYRLFAGDHVETRKLLLLK